MLDYKTIIKYSHKEILVSIFLLIALVLNVVPVRHSIELMVFDSMQCGIAANDEIIQVFYDVGVGISESNSMTLRRFEVTKTDDDNKLHIYKFPLPSKRINSIRIDPGIQPKTWYFHSIVLKSTYLDQTVYSYIWTPQLIFNEFLPSNDIGIFDLHNDRLKIETTGNDAQFFYGDGFVIFSDSMLEAELLIKNLLRSVTFLLLLIWFYLLRKEIYLRLNLLFKQIKKLFEPMPEVSFLFPFWFWLIFFMITSLKFWLVMDNSLNALDYALYDDALYVKLAENLIKGNWLGGYDNLTLVKHPFYSFWIALMFYLGIPLSFSHSFLYVFSCFIFTIAVRPLLRNLPYLILIVYATLLFHPISFPIIGMQRVIREGIYMSLPLLVLSFLIGSLLRKNASIKELIIWNVGFGLSLAAFLLTREEGIILFPSLILLMLVQTYRHVVFTRDKKKIFAVLFIPIMITFIIIGAVASINYYYYDAFIINDRTHRAFSGARDILVSVKPDEMKSYLPVSKETRIKIYQVSPAFAELEPFLDGKLLEVWGNVGPYKGDDISTHFNWALRDAVAMAGYYGSAKSSLNYYKRLTSEIQTACDSGQIDCYNKSPIPFVPTISQEHILPFFDIFTMMVVDVTTLEGISLSISPKSKSSEEGVLYFNDITRGLISPRESDYVKENQNKLTNIKIGILEIILSIYKYYMCLLIIFSIILFLYKIIYSVIKHKFSISLMISVSLLMAAVARIYMLSLASVINFPHWQYSLVYRSSTYPVVGAFSLLVILCFVIEQRSLFYSQVSNKVKNKTKA